MTFEPNHVVISGGTGALGRAIAEAFLLLGSRVYSSYLFEREIEALPTGFKDHPEFRLQKVDLTSESEVEAWMHNIGSVDVMVNVAGGFAMSKVEETSFKEWHQMMAINLDTAFLCSREALRRMDKLRGGRIINVGAYAATQKMGGMTPYKVSKAGVIHLTECLAEETLDTKVTVNAILPTIMDTNANRTAMSSADHSKWVPLKSVAETVLFLASPGAWPITGACIPLRGHS